MPQISLYVDESTLKKVESAAARQHLSISRWVVEQIRAKVEPVYPVGFEELFGSLKEEELIRPDQGIFTVDATRESL